MADPKAIVNKLIEAEPDPDAPEPYLDWLGQKVDTGPLKDIRFGAYIYLTDEDTIRTNAEEHGVDVENQDFWDAIERDMAIIEANALRLLREAGLHVSDEGHNESARVASVWIDTEEEDRRLALLKAVISWSEGDWPSTTSGTMDYAFGAHTTSDLYNNTSEIARFIDVTIEFTGTDALVEWSKLNLNEAITGDPDDPEVFLRSYVPRMLGRLLIEFNIIKPHFPDAPTNWYRENVDGMDLFRYNRVGEMREVLRQMKEYNRMRTGGRGGGLEQVTYRYRVPNPQGHSIVRRWLDKIGCPPTIIQWACETNPPIWFYTRVKEFNAYMQMVYPQVKLDPVAEGIDDVPVDDPDDPEAFIKRFKPHWQLLSHLRNHHFYFLDDSGRVAVADYSMQNQRDPATGDDGLLILDKTKPITRYRGYLGKKMWNIFVTQYQGGVGTKPIPSGIGASEEEFADLWPKIEPLGFTQAIREEGEEDDPRAYLDAVTGWIDTFSKAGMTADTSEGHEGQWWIKWRLGGAHFWIIVKVRRPIFMQVLVNDALYGRNYMQRTFEFRQDYQNVDQKLLVQWFQLMYRSINNAVKYDRNEPDIVAKLIKKIEGYYDDFKAKQDRGRLGEALDDPEMQHYLDKVVPEQCLHCGNDLTQRHTVVRVYYDRNLRSHELSGHYEGSEGYWTNDEQPSANLIAILPNVATFDDICQRCGTNTAQPMRHEESVDDVLDPKGDALRLMANAPMRYNELRNWRPYIHVPRDNFHNPENYYFTTLIVPVFTATGRLSKAHSWHGWLRMPEFTYDNPPTWEQRVAAVQKLVPRYLPGFYPDKLKRRGFQVGMPYEPYEGKFYEMPMPQQEALDPDDPGVNVERHIASMDIDQIMARLGFSERKPTWNCADPEYRWFERWTRGLKWTVIRASDEEPHIFEVTLYKPRTLETPHGKLPDYQEIGRLKVHIGELEARLGRAIKGRKVREGVELPPEDDPTDALERFAKHTEEVEADALESAINMAIEEFEIRVRLQGIDDIKHADQLAAEVGNQFAEMAGYHNGSDEYDMVVSAVNNACGEMFPTPDEPQMEAVKVTKLDDKWVRDALDVLVADGHVTPKEADTYMLAYNPENVAQLNQILIEIDRNIIDDAKIAQLSGIAANLIRQSNAQYMATLTDLTKGVTEAVDPDDPETAIRHTPIKVRAWAVGFHGQHQTQVDFDAGPYFDALANEENGLEMMINLAKEGFMMSREADMVAAWFSDTTLSEFFKNCTEMGYETHMSQNDVKRWVEHNKPDWYPYLWPKDTSVNKGYDVAEAVDPDDPEAYLRSMETDWREILKKHGFKATPNYEFLSWSMEFPDRVWGPNWPMRIYAGHGWGPEPEFDYIHPDEDNPDLDAEDAAFEQWLKDHPMGGRDVNFPDYVYFQFGRESHRRIEVPPSKLDSFLTRFLRAAKPILGTEHIDHDHPETADLTTMLYNAAKEVARGLQIPLRESTEPQVPVPPEDEPGDVIKQHEKGLLLPELERLGFTSRREKGVEWVYGDEIPRWWYKVYNDQTKHALYVYFWGGQTPEVQASVYDAKNKQWFRSGSEDPARAPAQSQAHLAAIVRDLDAAMIRMDPLNLPTQEQFEAIERVVIHHRKWWDDTLDYLINTQGGTLPGRMGPGQPA